MGLDGKEKIDKNRENPEQPSEEEILEQTKNRLGYLWSDVENQISAGVDKAKKEISKRLQSLDKWLSSEKEQKFADVRKNLSHLRDEVISHDHPQNPLDRSSAVEEEIIQRAVLLEKQILDDAPNDANFVAAGLGKLMRSIMLMEK